MGQAGSAGTPNNQAAYSHLAVCCAACSARAAHWQRAYRTGAHACTPHSPRRTTQGPQEPHPPIPALLAPSPTPCHGPCITLLFPPQADYLARDSLHCGVKVSCDFNRLMHFSKVQVFMVVPRTFTSVKPQGLHVCMALPMCGPQAGCGDLSRRRWAAAWDDACLSFNLSLHGWACHGCLSPKPNSHCCHPSAQHTRRCCRARSASSGASTTTSARWVALCPLQALSMLARLHTFLSVSTTTSAGWALMELAGTGALGRKVWALAKLVRLHVCGIHRKPGTGALPG